MADRHVRQAAAALKTLPELGRVLVSGASAESPIFAEAIMTSAEPNPSIFTGIFVPGLNRTTYLANARSRTETFFMTPELATMPEQVDFFPLCYADIGARLNTIRLDAAIMMVSPPDERGRCSFGPVVDFLAELWPRIPNRIAQINPLLPRTNGPAIPIDALHTVIEAATPVATSDPSASDAVSRRIGEHVASVIPDGATLQTGVGKIPAAILHSLQQHRDLRIHSGLVGDPVVDLQRAGALAAGAAVTAGVAIGSRRLYDAIGDDAFVFRPASVTHDAGVIAAIPNFMAINSAFEVDLLGQAYAECGPGGVASGPGGASDFARAARLSHGGLRIVALQAEARRGTVSRIVAPGGARGPVSLGRFDIDIVATEHGRADLRGLDYAGRAAALIAVASPSHRDRLSAAWEDYSSKILGLRT